MEKILLTGGKGFFASRFNEFYKDKYEIMCPGRQELDIRDEKKTVELIKDFRPDYVIHTAAIAVTKYCDEHPDIAHSINVDGALNVARGCELVDAKMIFTSSEQVFNGNPESGPYNEEHAPVPDTMYGKNKLEAEKKLREMLEKLWIVRFSWLFGLPDKGMKVNANIMWNTVSTVLSGKKDKVPVNEYRNMSYGYDVVEKFTKLFDIPYGTYHIASDNTMNRYETACFILKEMGIAHRIDELLEKDTEKYADHPRDVRLNTDKIKNLGINLLNTEEGIKKCIEDYSLKLV